MRDYDAVVIGGGINGLTTAAYLAKAGMSVGVFEARGQCGAHCDTVELGLGLNGASLSAADPAWKAGISSLRWRRCSGLSSTRTEFEPTKGLSTWLERPSLSTSGLAAKISLILSGRLVTTRSPKP